MNITGKVDIVHENHESAMLVMVPTISPANLQLHKISSYELKL